MIGAVEQINQIKTQFTNTKHFFDNFHSVGRAIHLDIQAKESASMNARQEKKVSIECTAALLNLVNVVQNATCLGYISNYFQIDSTVDQRTSSVNGFCGSCVTSAKAAVQNVLGVCNSTELKPYVDGFRALGFYTRFLCSQDSSNNQYCAITLAQTATTLAGITDFYSASQITQATLDKICVPCIANAVKILIQAGAGQNPDFVSAFIALRALCVKFNKGYCVLQLQTVSQVALNIIQKVATNTLPSADDFKSLLNILCSPCFRLVTARLLLTKVLAPVSLEYFRGFGALCRKNKAKEFCFVKIYNAISKVVTTQTNPCNTSSLSTGCTTECKDLITNLVTTGGCCWSILVDFSTQYAPGVKNEIKDAYINFVKSCNPTLTLPEACPSVANATFTITFTNIDINAITTDTQTFLSNVISDLGVSLGGLNGHGSAQVSTSKRANTATVTVNDVAVDPSASGVFTADVYSCSSACQGTSYDPTQSVETRSSVSNVVVQSSASTFTATFLLLALLVLSFF